MDFDREAFIDGYITAALWADGMPANAADEDAETGGLEHLQIRPEAREHMAADCHSFVTANLGDLLAYCERIEPKHGEAPESYAGHDFWLTRRGHGAGFWDRGLGELGERLTEAASKFDMEPATPYDCGDGTADIDR